MCICDNLARTKIRLRSLRKLYPEATALKVLHREVIGGRLVALAEGVIDGRQFSHVFCSGDVYWHQTHLRGRDGIARVARVGHDTYSCSRKKTFAQKTQEAVARKLSLVLTSKGMVMALFNTVARGGYVGQRLGQLYVQEAQSILGRLGIEHRETFDAVNELIQERVIGLYGMILTNPPPLDTPDEKRVLMAADNPMLVFEVSGDGIQLQVQKRFAYGEATVCVFDKSAWLCTVKRVRLLCGAEFGLDGEDVALFEEMFMKYLERGSLEWSGKGP